MNANHDPAPSMTSRTHQVRLRGRESRGEDAARPRRLRLRRRPLRRDERRHVRRVAPAVEAFRGRARRRSGRDRRVLDLAGGTGDLARAVRAARRRGGRRRAHRHQRRHARRRSRQARRPRHRAADGAVQRRSAAVRVAHLRRGVDRVRPAQRDAQGGGIVGNAARAASGRRLRGARILARRGAACTRVRLVQLQRAAALGTLDRQRRGKLSLPRRVDPRASGPGDAEAVDGTSRLRPGRLS